MSLITLTEIFLFFILAFLIVIAFELYFILKECLS